jgi:hypothetical protein
MNFIRGNFDIVEKHKRATQNIIEYYGSSFFDNEFYLIKRKKLEDYNDDISNKEQKIL